MAAPQPLASMKIEHRNQGQTFVPIGPSNRLPGSTKPSRTQRKRPSSISLPAYLYPIQHLNQIHAHTNRVTIPAAAIDGVQRFGVVQTPDRARSRTGKSPATPRSRRQFEHGRRRRLTALSGTGADTPAPRRSDRCRRPARPGATGFSPRAPECKSGGSRPARDPQSDPRFSSHLRPAQSRLE